MKTTVIKNSPFVKNTDEPARRFKPEVERSIRRSIQGIDVVAFSSIEELFADLDAHVCSTLNVPTAL